MHYHVPEFRVLNNLFVSHSCTFLYEPVGAFRAHQLILACNEYLEGSLYVLGDSVPLQVKPQPLSHRHVPYWHLTFGVAEGVREEVEDMAGLSALGREGDKFLLGSDEVQVLNPGTVL